MNNKYTYSLLKYKHSTLLGECLNVGLLLYFHTSKTLEFIFTGNLARVNAIYLNAPERVLRNYVREIDNRVSFLNTKLDDLFIDDIENRFDSFIDNFILPSDGSSLQFEEGIVSFQYEKSNIDIIEHLKNLYLFEISTSKENKEYEIGKSFYQSIKNYVKEVGKSNSPNFYKDYSVENETGVEFKFKYAWQNGTLNLVKPLNFDLSDPKHVASKGHQNYGLFFDLNNVAVKKKLRYDLIIGEPKQKGLIKEFNHSIKLLERLNHVKLIPESKLNKYTQDLISTIKK